MIVGIYFFGNSIFRGDFDRNYTLEELTKNFTNLENEFAELMTEVNEKISGSKQQLVAFGSSRVNQISLGIYPSLVNSTSKIIGGNNLEIGNAQLDSAFLILG